MGDLGLSFENEVSGVDACSGSEERARKRVRKSGFPSGGNKLPVLGKIEC